VVKNQKNDKKWAAACFFKFSMVATGVLPSKRLAAKHVTFVGLVSYVTIKTRKIAPQHSRLGNTGN